MTSQIKKMNKYIQFTYILTIIVFILSVTQSFITYFGSTYIGWVENLLILFWILPCLRYILTTRNFTFRCYFLIMFIAFILHLTVYNISIKDNFWEVSNWVILFFIMAICTRFNTRSIYYLAITFFVSECTIAIYERIMGGTSSHTAEKYWNLLWRQAKNQILNSEVSVF